MSVIEEIAAERRRQIEAEGYTHEHDDGHPGEMARAAAAYADVAASGGYKNGRLLSVDFSWYLPAFSDGIHWPWEWEAYKPTDPRRDLIKAAALIVAEIERIDRASVAERQRA